MTRKYDLYVEARSLDDGRFFYSLMVGGVAVAATFEDEELPLISAVQKLIKTAAEE